MVALETRPNVHLHEKEFNNADLRKTAIDRNAFALGIALSAPLPVPAFSAPVPSAMPTSFSTWRARSDGPMMTVDSIKGNQIDHYWINWDGVPISESFPADVLQKF